MSLRKSSLDPIFNKDWRWAFFLDETKKVLSAFSPEPIHIDQNFLDKQGSFGSKSDPRKVTTQTWACKTSKLRLARAACVDAAKTASILNLVIHPLHTYELPFFGADFVTLSSGHLLALDLQPALKNDKLHTEEVWDRLLPIHSYWQDLLPAGGPIPEEAQPYFSPGFLWTRLPLGKESEAVISQVIRPAFKDYLGLYFDLVKRSELITDSRSTLILKGQKRYLRYRAAKDPARAMLTGFYGREWTENYIQSILFNQ